MFEKISKLKYVFHRVSPDTFFRDGLNIIETDARNRFFFDYLKQRGLKERYLGLSRKSKVIEHGGKNKSVCYYPYISSKQVKMNNADLLILSGTSSVQLLYFDNYCHAESIMVSFKFFRFYFYLSLLGLIKNILLDNINIAGCITLRIEGKKRRLWVLRNLKKDKGVRRRYLSPRLGVEDFFKKIKDKNLNYLILRWFDQLPEIDKDEDIDILVSDKDVVEFEKTLNMLPGSIPVDLYSVSGDTNVQSKMSYYPPNLAIELLENTETKDNLYRVPSPDYYFLSLVYHILYHKGHRSGLVNNQGLVFHGEPEHDYKKILEEMTSKLGLDLNIDMDSLDDFLDSKGWRPSNDALRRLSNRNEWIRAKYFSIDKKPFDYKGSMAVFILRDSAVDLKMDDMLLDLIRFEGFSIVYSGDINKEVLLDVKNNIRGGNWTQNTWAYPGGGPAKIVVAYDLVPITPDEVILKKNPQISNTRVLYKNRIRRIANSYLKKDQYSNMIHSSDNDSEAWEYVDIILPEKKDTIVAELKKMDECFKTDYPVLRDMSNNGKRAKVELIEYNGGKAVKKTFKPGCEMYFENELKVMTEFSKECSNLPTLLKKGDNYLIFPFYKNTLIAAGEYKNIRWKHFLPIHVAKDALKVLKYFYNKGYFLYDAIPANLLYSNEEGLKFIDFELMQEYGERPKDFSESYDIVGSNINLSKEIVKRCRNYNHSWKPVIGVDFDDLQKESAFVLHVKQLRYKAVNHALGGTVSGLRKSINKVIKKRLESVKGVVNYLARRY